MSKPRKSLLDVFDPLASTDIDANVDISFFGGVHGMTSYPEPPVLTKRLIDIGDTTLAQSIPLPDDGDDDEDVFFDSDNDLIRARYQSGFDSDDDDDDDLENTCPPGMPISPSATPRRREPRTPLSDISVTEATPRPFFNFKMLEQRSFLALDGEIVEDGPVKSGQGLGEAFELSPSPFHTISGSRSLYTRHALNNSVERSRDFEHTAAHSTSSPLAEKSKPTIIVSRDNQTNLSANVTVGSVEDRQFSPTSAPYDVKGITYVPSDFSFNEKGFSQADTSFSDPSFLLSRPTGDPPTLDDPDVGGLSQSFAGNDWTPASTASLLYEPFPASPGWSQIPCTSPASSAASHLSSRRDSMLHTGTATSHASLPEPIGSSLLDQSFSNAQMAVSRLGMQPAHVDASSFHLDIRDSSFDLLNDQIPFLSASESLSDDQHLAVGASTMARQHPCLLHERSPFRGDEVDVQGFSVKGKMSQENETLPCDQTFSEDLLALADIGRKILGRSNYERDIEAGSLSPTEHRFKATSVHTPDHSLSSSEDETDVQQTIRKPRLSPSFSTDDNLLKEVPDFGSVIDVSLSDDMPLSINGFPLPDNPSPSDQTMSARGSYLPSFNYDGIAQGGPTSSSDATLTLTSVVSAMTPLTPLPDDVIADSNAAPVTVPPPQSIPVPVTPISLPQPLQPPPFVPALRIVKRTKSVTQQPHTNPGEQPITGLQVPALRSAKFGHAQRRQTTSVDHAPTPQRQRSSQASSSVLTLPMSSDKNPLSNDPLTRSTSVFAESSDDGDHRDGAHCRTGTAQRSVSRAPSDHSSPGGSHASNGLSHYSASKALKNDTSTHNGPRRFRVIDASDSEASTKPVYQRSVLQQGRPFTNGVTREPIVAASVRLNGGPPIRMHIPTARPKSRIDRAQPASEALKSPRTLHPKPADGFKLPSSTQSRPSALPKSASDSGNRSAATGGLHKASKLPAPTSRKPTLGSTKMPTPGVRKAEPGTQAHGVVSGMVRTTSGIARPTTRLARPAGVVKSTASLSRAGGRSL
ncbi:hypothetical protein FISHEDRAFT_56754 [Fistulina hepatica ATCC 64428]|uniref:Uncharacterized protein n=1 Tax=Fistulina hepatica ATCC 64428 TaxID=1128425 RepID=A0A0D7AI10_9AGAR|nr:hypothetical protein FISHEDRAFT_56754 [Fistulina hepatica ATCC 64428]